MNVSLELQLSPNNKLHAELASWLETASLVDKLNALLIGFVTISCEALNQQHPDTVQRIKRIQAENDERISRMRDQHNKDIESYRSQIHSSTEQWISKYEEVTREYNEYIKKTVDNDKDKEILELKTQLTVLQNTNSYKGAIGELQVKDVLSKAFPAYEIKDTSSQNGMSDIHLVDQAGRVLVIECKNKASVTAQDVNKSMNDIKNIKQKLGEKFVGYMFVSIRSQNIPKKGDLLYEVIEGVPCVWYGTSQEFSNDVCKLVRLIYMLNACQVATCNDFPDKVNTYLRKIQEIKKNIDSLHNSINAMKTNINSLQSALDWMFDDMSSALGISEPTQLCHVCPQCQAKYKRRGDLERHIKAKHVSSLAG